MGRRSRISKIIIGLILLSMPAWGQSSIDMPLVSDKAAAVKDSTVRVVDKDEIQRIVWDMNVKIKRLEDKIKLLEADISDLKNKIEEGG